MSTPKVFYNASCLKCNAVNKKMMKVGVLFFCDSCFLETFKTEDPVKKERKKYLELLEKYNDKLDFE